MEVHSESEKPVNLLIKEDDGKFKLDEAAMRRVLEDVEGPAVVISVAGPFRKGKSFLLDYMLRYLRSGCKHMGKELAPLDGFTWRGGSERDTTGLVTWSKVYDARLEDGRKAGIVLLDTQGTFDSHSTVRESAIVFALSTLLSSVQIYNLAQNIQEDDLQHLQLFTEYGRVASRHTSSHPFQRLIFLVRDWSYPYEAEYGFKGGKKIVERRLKPSPGQPAELRDIRKHIAECFFDVRGFLMPYPGGKVAVDPDFDGRLSDLDVTFRRHLEDFVGSILSPENLLVKKVNSEELQVKDLLYYLKTYMDLFSGDSLPEPRSILSATAEANHLAAVAAAKDSYSKKMSQFCGSAKAYVRPEKLEKDHQASKALVMHEFRTKPKMGSVEYTESFRVDLETSIDEMYNNFKELNLAKNCHGNILTPGLLLSSAILFYFVSGFMALIGLYSVSNWCNAAVVFCLVGAGTWAYTKCTGEFQQVTIWIDSLAFFMWHSIIMPMYLSAFVRIKT